MSCNLLFAIHRSSIGREHDLYECTFLKGHSVIFFMFKHPTLMTPIGRYSFKKLSFQISLGSDFALARYVV